jgi:hypothetical protein
MGAHVKILAFLLGNDKFPFKSAKYPGHVTPLVCLWIVGDFGGHSAITGLISRSNLIVGRQCQIEQLVAQLNLDFQQAVLFSEVGLFCRTYLIPTNSHLFGIPC